MSDQLLATLTRQRCLITVPAHQTVLSGDYPGAYLSAGCLVGQWSLVAGALCVQMSALPNQPVRLDLLYNHSDALHFLVLLLC